MSHVASFNPRSRHPRALSWIDLVFFFTILLAFSSLARAQDLQEQATNAYLAGNYAKSAELFLKALETGNGDPTLSYNAACALALDGQADAAMQQLHAAVRNGFFNTNQLKKDPDLESLRARDDWNALIQQVELVQQSNARRWGTEAFTSPYKPQLSAQEKRLGLTLIWAEARYGFVNFDLAPDSLDWNARYLKFIPRVEQAQTTFEYYRQLQAFISGLHDGHSSVAFPPQIYKDMVSSPALRTERIGEDVVITRVDDPALLVHVGDVITSIDGQEVDDYAESQVIPYYSYSTPQDRMVREYDYGLLLGPANESVKLELVDSEGRKRSVEIPRRTADRPPRTPPPAFELSWQEHDIAYVRLNSFGSMKAADEWHAQYDEIRQRARGIVFDIRNNGGGNSNVGYSILADLIDHATRTSSQELMVYRATLRAWGQGQRHDPLQYSSIAPSNRPHFEGPVAVLIGPRTYSAAEDFAVAFDMTGRGALIGTATGGSTGQPLSFALPGGGSARICTKRDRYADGREFVGKGVQPDIEVGQTLQAIRLGQDLVLQRALEWIQQQK
ncbi:MAG TPA: S41 family peptidase [Candidatus Krumholzibacteria bacterium]|nr:S41 family peptidase [Candidatus Krumholzibacteria bacterium]